MVPQGLAATARCVPESQVQVAILEQATAEAAREIGDAVMLRGLDALGEEYK